MKPGSVILLNGASSAGKSTLARAIQDAADIPFLRFSLDFFMFGDVLPQRRDGDFAWALIRPRLFEGYYGCLGSLARAGNNLVVDHIIEDQAGFDRLMGELSDIDVFMVGVHCPLDELERRELARADRRIGDARRVLEFVHTFCCYDLEVDSTLSLESNARKIIEAWKRRHAPT